MEECQKTVKIHGVSTKMVHATLHKEVSQVGAQTAGKKGDEAAGQVMRGIHSDT